MKKNKRPNQKYWTKKDVQELKTVKNYTELVTIALRVIDRMPQPITQMCGPISTGGKGSVEENIKEFDKAIFFFIDKGEYVFDQIPFQDAMVRLKKEVASDEYDQRILTEFYLPIFKSGKIKELKFLPGWESSRGARWEHQQAETLEINFTHLPEKWYKTI